MNTPYRTTFAQLKDYVIIKQIQHGLAAKLTWFVSPEQYAFIRHLSGPSTCLSIEIIKQEMEQIGVTLVETKDMHSYLIAT